MQRHRLIAGIGFLCLLLGVDVCAEEVSFVCAGGGGAIEEGRGSLAKRTGGSGSEVVAGIQHAVVIFAKFKNEAVSDAAPAWRTDLFDPELPGSLRHFYAEMSFGAYTLEGTCLPRRYASDHPAEHYGEEGYGIFNREILMKADRQVDFGTYDNDGPDGIPNSGDDDGVVDFVFINLSSRPKGFLSASLKEAIGIASLGFSEELITDDGSAEGGFIRIGGKGATQWVWDFEHAAGVMAHEYGHILGLPDLYDTDYEEPEEDSGGIGNWGLMGRGALGWHVETDPDGPVPFCAWSREQLGWIGELVEVTDAMEGVRMEDVEMGGKVLKIQATKHEYFLVENRQRSGGYYDRHIPNSGLLIYHIDPTVSWGYLAEEHKEVDDGLYWYRTAGVDIECADGLYRDRGYPGGMEADPIWGKDNLDFWAHDVAYRTAHHGNLGDGTDVFDGVVYTAFGPETNPSSALNSGAPTGIEVRNIRFEGTTAVVDVRTWLPILATQRLAFLDENGDGYMEAGEGVGVSLRMENGGGTAYGVQCILRTVDPYVVVEDSVGDVGEMSPGHIRESSVLRFRVVEGFWGRHRARFELEIRDDAGHVWMETVEGEFFSPQVPLRGLLVLDGGRDSVREFGNGDGVANPGETIRLQAVAEVQEDLLPFGVGFRTEDARVRAMGSSFLMASDIPEGGRIPFEIQVEGSFLIHRDTLYVEVKGKDETPPQVLGVRADPMVLEPGSSTTIRVRKASVVEGGSIERMEARIYAWTDSQFVDSVVLQEGEEEFWGEWSYGEEGRFFLGISAEDQGGNRMETRFLHRLTFYDLPEPGPFSSGEWMTFFKEWMSFTSGNSGLPVGGVLALAFDSQGNLWIGTEGALTKFDGARWEVYHSGNSGLPDDWVESLAIDSQGNLWIGTWGGLAKFDGARWEVYHSENSGLPDNWVWSLAVDFWGDLWIGTWEGGLATFDGFSWTVYDSENSGLPNNGVSSLAFDAQGNLWIGTREGGLATFDGFSWTVYDSENSGLPSNWVSSLAFDAQGNLWIGAGGLFAPAGGLAKFDGESWEVYDTGNSGLPDNNVLSLAFDYQGNLWIGTWDGGLVVYREGGVILRVTAVGEELGTTVPSAFSLSQNYPNPFNPRTTIAYDLPHACAVTLTIYALTGQKVGTLVSGHQEAGHHEVTWNDREFASGIYFYRMEAGGFEQTRRMVLLK